MLQNLSSQELMGTDSSIDMQDHLPQWRLEDLYPAPTSPLLTEDLARIADGAAEFRGRYQGQIRQLSSTEFAGALKAYEEIDARIAKVGTYISLCYAQAMGDAEIGRFYATTQESLTQSASQLLFFSLEINRLEEKQIEALLAAAELAHYRPFVRDCRVLAPYQLEERLEQLLLEKSLTGFSAWNRLFDETLAGMRFKVGDEFLPLEATLDLLADKSAQKRQAGAKALGAGLGEKIQSFSLIYNTLIKDKEIEDRWRGYAQPYSARNLSNLVEDDVVEALVAATQRAYPDLSHRYYRLKAGWFGGQSLPYWDRNAPLAGASDRRIPWAEAQEVVLGAYREFSPVLGEIGARFFTEGWIDAAPRPGKSPGAFAHPCVPSVHPYILLNYQGRSRDVMTLAHELGHGIHQVLAGQTQGHLLAQTPLTLAETASVFGEMLTFQSLLAKQHAPKARMALLAAKVEDMLNTVIRQIAFFTFERQVHLERRKGEITAERLGEIWLEVQTQSLGPAIDFDAEYRHYWAYIGHFIHTPFYVYAYAFGDCLVNALYAIYEQRPKGFAAQYQALLAAGGSKRHGELLAPFGSMQQSQNFGNKALGLLPISLPS
jgi:oligoendopeptidase F